MCPAEKLVVAQVMVVACDSDLACLHRPTSLAVSVFALKLLKA
jgi:hypothetical protein